ncbi:hypothetical protein GF324_13995 [bacterium]|nr:hypothetical protein [bacterium]
MDAEAKLDLFQHIRQSAMEQTETVPLAKSLLRELAIHLSVDDSQLSLYYDLPFGLEVTHIRFKQDDFLVHVDRVREDDTESVEDTTLELLTPVTAAHNEMLTCRERMVGLFLVGTTEHLDTNDEWFTLIHEVSVLLAEMLDNAMMFRRNIEISRRLFESEKLASIGQLASGLAHELRNPLSSLKMNLQGLARSAELDKRNERRVRISMEEIERLDSIIGELMHFARRTKFEVAPTHPAELLERSLELAQAPIQEHGIQVQSILPLYLPTIEVDRDRIVRTLLNLILNAVQAMEPGGILKLEAEALGEWVEIRVADTGKGIPPDLQRDIFNPFFTTKADGNGLGLANALKYVQEHGGEMEVSSEVGKGTTFSLRLPPCPPKQAEDPSALRVLPT